MTSMLLMLNITDNKQIGVWPLEWAHKHKKVLVPVKVNGQKKCFCVCIKRCICTEESKKQTMWTEVQG